MSLEQLQQNFTDATGFILDRTVNPPKILGQAFLISRNRAVCCASSVFNYTEAPWALAVSFPHPDVIVGLRGMVVHPEFDKKAARTWYLTQTGVPGEQLVISNDIATLSIDMGLAEMPPDKVGELNRALTMPFSGAGVEASGAIRGSEFLSILTGVLQANRSGLLTLFDSRNIPLARLQIGPGMIQKVYYKSLVAELAFFELVYRKPAEGYAFQSESDFNWGNMRDISAPADVLIEEATRRAEEMPTMYKQLGGPEARYQQRIENYEAETAASEGIRWFADHLWASIDGYMTIDKLGERAGIDTYSAMQGIREMVNKAQVSLINRAPFHENGQLGSPLVSHTDFEVHAWDPLQSFFLDPLSGRPIWLQGNFFGVANALQPKNMLHTIAMPNNVPGAMILKDYKLIGIHSGPHVPKPNQPVPPVKVFQMMWMGALLELSGKKKDGEKEGEPAAMSALRSRDGGEEQKPTSADKLEKFVCPNCYTTNTQIGPCFNCGTEITLPEPTAEEQAKAAAAAAKPKMTSQQMMIIGVGAALVIVAASMMMGGQPPPPPTVVPTDSSAEHKSSEKSVKLAVEAAGFKATAVPGYWYEDTSDITKPTPSFGLYSELANQKINFLIFDDMSPVQNLKNFCGLPPFAGVLRSDSLADSKVDENYQVLGDGYLHWFVGRYASTASNSNLDMVLIGAFPSPIKGKSVLVVGQSLKANNQPYDYKSSLSLIDTMAADYTARGNKAKLTESGKVVDGSTSTSTATGDQAPAKEKPIATPEQLDEFTKHVEESIMAQYKTPDDVQDELKKKHPPKLKCSLNVVLDDNDGSIKKLEIKQQADMDSLTQALTRAVNEASEAGAFKDPPHTKDGTIALLIKIDKDKIAVERP